MKIGIVYNNSKNQTKKFNAQLADWLKNKGCKVVQLQHSCSKNPNVDFIISLGGDGTILRTSRMVAKYSIPILGVNLGTLGFLTDCDTKMVYEQLENILENGITYEQRMMLSVEIRTEKKLIKTTALNDCVIRSVYNGRLASIDAFLNGKFLCNYKGDGIVIATPTGSTAYSLAINGPIVYPTLSLIIINPISSHKLSHRPVIIPADNTIEFDCAKEAKQTELVVCTDGQANYILKKGHKVKIKMYPNSAKFIKHIPYFETLKNKLNWGV